MRAWYPQPAGTGKKECGVAESVGIAMWVTACQSGPAHGAALFAFFPRFSSPNSARGGSGRVRAGDLDLSGSPERGCNDESPALVHRHAASNCVIRRTDSFRAENPSNKSILRSVIRLHKYSVANSLSAAARRSVGNRKGFRGVLSSRNGIENKKKRKKRIEINTRRR